MARNGARGPVTRQVTLALQPLHRAAIIGEALDASASIPGEFAFDGLRMDAYGIRVLNLPKYVYVHDIEHNGVSILHKSLRIGAAVGADRLRVLVADKASFVEAKVIDEDGNPETDANVFVIPESVTSEPELAARLVSGQADQYGVYSSAALAPGEYYVVAARIPLDLAKETIARLWYARPKAKTVTAEPGGTAHVAIHVTAM